MWSLGTSPALFLLFGLLVGLAVFMATVISVWTNRSDVLTQRSAKAGIAVAFPVGLVGVAHWVVILDKALFSAETAWLLAVYMAPAFTISFYIYKSWLRRSSEA